MSLKEYNRKRDFKKTPEPPGKAGPAIRGDLRFVVQMHRATRLHFDLRLEMGGVYRSWAVPREPSQNPLDQRLAVFVEDHPIDYGDFEGIIPRGNYGAGTVMLWDRGTFQERFHLGEPRATGERAMLEGLEQGKLTFVMAGEKMRGEFALIRLKDKGNPRAWLLLKKRDEHATFKRPRGEAEEARSVVSGRTIAEIAAQSERVGDVWIPGKGRRTPARKLAAPKTSPKPASKSAEPRAYSPLASAKADLAKAGAKPVAARMPRRVRPMLPAPESEPFIRPDWLYTELTGGIRVLAEVERGSVHLHSRQLLPMNRKFPRIADALRHLGTEALLDGEVDEASGALRVLDLLYKDGHDLRHCPLDLRLKELARLNLPRGIELPKTRAGHPPTTGDTLAREAKSAYRSGVSAAWLKLPGTLETKTAAAPTRVEEPAFTHREKIYFPKDGYTKGDLIDYYREVSGLILPHLRDRPESMNRHPDGIHQPGFFQKDVTGFRPRWVRTERVYSGSSQKTINYLVCDDQRTLLYMANLGCIELNPWFSRFPKLDFPDWLVIDLDPDDNPFKEVVKVAHATRAVLEDLELPSYLKTSGATGLHVAVPLGAQYEFSDVVRFAEALANAVHSRVPDCTSVVRNPGKRRGRIYLDFLQNRRGQTLAAPYCVRPRPGATVSTPLEWKELTAKLDPRDFTIRTAPKRFAKVGDLWAPVLGEGIDLPTAEERLSRWSPID